MEMEDELPDPTTRKEFSEMRAENNTSILVHKCLEDRGLQWRLRVVVALGRHVHFDYVHCLDSMKGGPESMRKFAAERACWGWYSREILGLLRDLHNKELLQNALGFTKQLSNAMTRDSMQPWFTEEKRQAELVHRFAVSLCQEETWSQLMYSLTLPHALAGMLHEDQVRADAQLDFLRELADTIAAAEQQVQNFPLNNTELNALLDSARFVSQQFSRELLCVGNVHGWTRSNRDLWKTATLMADGSSTTADCLEKCFAYLQDVTRPMKSNRIDHMHLWFSASASPWTANGGMKQVATTHADYVNLAAEHPNRTEKCQQLLSMSETLEQPIISLISGRFWCF